jgi:hypothetical protein
VHGTPSHLLLQACECLALISFGQPCTHGEESASFLLLTAALHRRQLATIYHPRVAANLQPAKAKQQQHGMAAQISQDFSC